MAVQSHGLIRFNSKSGSIDRRGSGQIEEAADVGFNSKSGSIDSCAGSQDNTFKCMSFNSKSGSIDSFQQYSMPHFPEVSIPKVVRLIVQSSRASVPFIVCFNSKSGSIDRKCSQKTGP